MHLYCGLDLFYRQGLTLVAQSGKGEFGSFCIQAETAVRTGINMLSAVKDSDVRNGITLAVNDACLYYYSEGKVGNKQKQDRKEQTDEGRYGSCHCLADARKDEIGASGEGIVHQGQFYFKEFLKFLLCNDFGGSSMGEQPAVFQKDEMG